MKKIIILVLVFVSSLSYAVFSFSSMGGDSVELTIDPIEYHALTICNSDGKCANLDFEGDSLRYSGDLPVDESAKIFFEKYRYLCNCHEKTGSEDCER